MKLISNVENYRNIYSSQVQSKTNANNFEKIPTQDVFVKSNVSFKSALQTKTKDVVVKAGVGILTSFLAWLGIKNIQSLQEKTIESSENLAIQTQETFQKENITFFEEYSSAEKEVINLYDSKNREIAQKLREILKHDKKTPEDRFLNKTEEVILLAEKLEENPAEIESFIKSNPFTDAKELVELLQLQKKRATAIRDVKRVCPYAIASEIKAVADIYNKLYVHERETLSKYNEIKKLKYEMKQLQGDKAKEKVLLEKFEKYKWLSPEKIKKELKQISITSANIENLPIMSVEDLAEELKYKKSPEYRADVMRARMNTPIRPYRDPLLEKK